MEYWSKHMACVELIAIANSLPKHAETPEGISVKLAETFKMIIKDCVRELQPDPKND